MKTVIELDYTECIKMIGAISICHYVFENARISTFSTWNEGTGVQVLCACAVPLPSSLSRSVTSQNDNGDSGAESVLCAAICEALNQLFLCSGHSGDNLTVIPPSPNSIRRWYQQLQTTGCLCKGKSAGRPRVSEESLERVRYSFFNPL